MRRLLAAAVLAGVAWGLAPAPAFAAPEMLMYSGTHTVPSPNGEMVTEPASYVFLCEDGVCVREGVDSEVWRLTITDGRAVSSGSWQESGDPCGSDFESAGNWQVVIDATGLVGSASFTSDIEMECPATAEGASSRVWVRPATYSWEGTLERGDPCVFAPNGCAGTGVPASATPAATTSPAGPGTPAPSAPAPAPGTESGSRLGSGDPAAPSVVSRLRTPAEAAVAPQQLLTAVLLTIILVLLVAFPTSLLNSAVDTGTDRFSQWWGSRRAAGPGQQPGVPVAEDALAGAAADPVPEPAPAKPGRGWWWAAAGVGLAGLISAFVDPEFGLNPGSLRLLASVLVGFAIDVVLGWAVTIWLVRRVAPGATHSYQFKPVTLLVVVAAVVLTRVTGFEPGIVFGLVAGVAFGALAGAAAEGRAALAEIGWAFGAAVVAWLVYGALGGPAATGDNVLATFAVETLGSVAIGGMASLPIALFPLRGLAGSTIWQWDRWVWAAAYAVGLLAFFVVLMPMPFSWQGVEWSLVGWVSVYLAYLLTALVLWLVVAKPWQREVAPAASD